MSNHITIAQGKDLLASLLEALDSLPAEKKLTIEFGFQVLTLGDLDINQSKTALRKAQHALSEFKDEDLIMMQASAREYSTVEQDLLLKTREIHSAKNPPPKVEAPEKKIIVPEHLAGETTPLKEGEAPAPAKIIETSNG